MSNHQSLDLMNSSSCIVISCNYSKYIISYSDSIIISKFDITEFFGLIPIAVFLGLILIASYAHYVFGYRYNPMVANEFTDDLALIHENIEPGTVILIKGDTLEYDFYKILEEKENYTISSDTPSSSDKEKIKKIISF